MDISQKCHFRGGAQACVTQLQNAFLDLEYCTGAKKKNLEEKTTLLQVIEDTNYHATRDTLALDSGKSYHDSLSAIDQHATMYIGTIKRNQEMSITPTRREMATKIQT